MPAHPPADNDLVLDFAAEYQVALGEGRPAVLPVICAARPDLIPAVEEVLRDAGVAYEARAVVIQPSDEEAEPMPERLGRYALEHELGQGTFGVAFRASDTQLNRDVAVKLLRVRWVNRPQAARRFLDEARVTAQLQHPTIPAVHEVGEFADGRPWMAMKLIRGHTLHELLKANDPSLNRLAVFEAVCQGLSYAHSKGVIHRDLKPENVMVGAFGEVQLMDWGLAKVLGRAVTGGTAGSEETVGTAILSGRESDGTQAGSAVGTPAYMAPEQAIGAVDRIDRRSDVFGLGGILCRLLTGKPPFVGGDAESTRQLAAMGKVQDAFARLDACGADPELVALCMKCLAPDQADRPADAGRVASAVAALRAAADDRARRAEVDRAKAEVQAVAERKRRLVLFIGSFTLVLVLLAGTAVSMWQMFRAVDAEKLTTEREKETAKERDAKGIALANEAAERQKADAATAAEREAKGLAEGRRIAAEKATEAEKVARQRAEGIARFLTAVFRSPDPARDGRSVTVAELLDRAARVLAADRGIEPVRRATLQATLGGTYDALGLAKQALPLLEAARDAHIAAAGPDHPDTLSVLNNLALAYFRAGRRKDALDLREQVLALRRKVSGVEHPMTLVAMVNLAGSYSDAGRRAESAKLLDEALPLSGKVNGADHPDTIRAMNDAAIALAEGGSREAALGTQRQLLPLSQRVNGPDHPETLLIAHNVAITLFELGRSAEAVTAFEELLTLNRKTTGPEHPDTLRVMASLAGAYSELGRSDKALKLHKELLPLCRRVNGPEHPDTLIAMNILAASQLRAGQPAEAVKLLAELVPLRRKVSGPEHSDTLTAINNLAAAHLSTGSVDEAIRLLDDLVTLYREIDGPDKSGLLTALTNLAAAYVKTGRRADSLKLTEELLTLSRKVKGDDHPDTLILMGNLADLQFQSGRRDDALKLQAELVRRRRVVSGMAHPDTLKQINNLAGGYLRVGRYEEAIPLHEELLPENEKIFGPEHPQALATIGNLGMCYANVGRWADAIRLLEHVLPLHRKVSGPEHAYTLGILRGLAASYEAVGQTEDALRLRREVIAICRKQMPKDSPPLAAELTVHALALLGVKGFANAEPMLRESLAIREKGQPDAWTTFNTRSMLGEALLGQRKFADAEPLLLDGYQGLKAAEKTLPPPAAVRIPESLDRLIGLYTATNKPDQVKKYRELRAKYPPETAPRPKASRETLPTPRPAR